MSNKLELEHLRSEIENLQVKVAYQEDTIEQLNKIVTEQQAQLQYLQKLSSKVIEKLQSVQVDDAPSFDAVELPPHY